MVSWTTPTIEAINHRISQAQVFCGKISPPFCKASVSKNTKLTIFRSYVVSALLYGLSTLTLEDKHLKNIDSWSFKFLGRVMGIKASYYSSIPNSTVRAKSKLHNDPFPNADRRAVSTFDNKPGYSSQYPYTSCGILSGIQR